MPSPSASEAVIAGDDGLLPHLGRDSVIIEMSTVSPSLVRGLASRCRERGVHFLDCGMSGGPGGARDASLALMVGGDAAVLERVALTPGAIGFVQKANVSGDTVKILLEIEIEIDEG